MKVSIGAVIAAEDCLATLAKLKLPAKVAVQLFRMAKVVRSEAEVFHAKRNELMRQLGTERPSETPEEKALGPSIVTVPQAHIPAFMKELTELSTVEVEMTCEPLPVSLLGDIQLSIEDLDKLGPFIKLDE
jgi:hypothetical protein